MSADAGMRERSGELAGELCVAHGLEHVLQRLLPLRRPGQRAYVGAGDCRGGYGQRTKGLSEWTSGTLSSMS
jgi:hypothetical protein